MITLEVTTQAHHQFLDMTASIVEAVAHAGFLRGAVMVFVPHTTAGCTINENADPDVVRDILTEINKTIPAQSDYLHAEGNSAAHIQASLMGSSVLVPVEEGRLQLGRWQGVYFCEFDGPRRRKVQLQFLQGM